VQRYQVTQLTDTSEDNVANIGAYDNAREISFELELPPDGEPGTFIKYRVWAIDPWNNKAPPSNIVAVRIPLSTGLAAWAWGLIGGGIALLVILLIILLCKTKWSYCNRNSPKTVTLKTTTYEGSVIFIIQNNENIMKENKLNEY
jgi:hypothetical protein